MTQEPYSATRKPPASAKRSSSAPVPLATCMDCGAPVGVNNPGPCDSCYQKAIVRLVVSAGLVALRQRRTPSRSRSRSIPGGAINHKVTERTAPDEPSSVTWERVLATQATVPPAHTTSSSPMMDASSGATIDTQVPTMACTTGAVALRQRRTPSRSRSWSAQLPKEIPLPEEIVDLEASDKKSSAPNSPPKTGAKTARIGVSPVSDGEDGKDATKDTPEKRTDDAGQAVGPSIYQLGYFQKRAANKCAANDLKSLCLGDLSGT